jgi:hypothetical protein
VKLPGKRTFGETDRRHQKAFNELSGDIETLDKRIGGTEILTCPFQFLSFEATKLHEL